MTAPWYEHLTIPTEFPVRLVTGDMAGFTLHWHELIEIVYVSGGTVQATVDSQVYDLSSGDIALIDSGRIHGFESTVARNSTMIFQFGPELFGPLLPDLRIAPGSTAFSRFPRVDRSSPLGSLLASELQTIGSEMTEQNRGWRLAVTAALYRIGLEILRADEPEPPRQSSGCLPDARRRTHRESLERVFSYVAEHYHEPVRLDDAARVAALSRYHFCRYFREHTGQRFQDYLRRVRVSHAERLLVETTMPVSLVAEQSGFRSVKTFHRVFRTTTGCTPTQYRGTAPVYS